MTGGGDHSHIRIRSAELADTAALAAMHCEALPNDLLPRLGQRALAGTVYPLLLAAPDIWVTLIEANGKVSGFIVGECALGAVSRQLFSHLPRLSGPLASACLRHPWLVRDILCGTVLRRTTWQLPPGPPAQREIAFVAVATAAQGGGLGQSLMADAIARARASGCRLVVRTSSVQAERFYNRCGFTRAGGERRCARQMAVLVA